MLTQSDINGIVQEFEKNMDNNGKCIIELVWLLGMIDVLRRVGISIPEVELAYKIIKEQTGVDLSGVNRNYFCC